MPPQPPPPTNTPPPSSSNTISSPSKTPMWLWIVFAASLIIILALLMYAFQSSQYLTTQVLTSTQQQQDVTYEGDIPPVDTYTVIESHCQNIKQGHILECGYAPPEEDYNCRNAQADAAFQECMNDTTLADIVGIPDITDEEALTYLQEAQAQQDDLLINDESL